MGLPSYVSRRGHGEQSIEPPGVIEGAHLYAFAVPSDPAAVQALIDPQLNAPAGGALVYRVLGRTVFLTFLHADRLTSRVEPDGYLRDREFAPWIPLAVFERGSKEPSRLAFYNPYLIVDSSAAMATGREVWGFAKEVGELDVPANAGDDARFVAKAAISMALDSSSPAEMRPLVTIAATGPIGVLPRAWASVRDAMEAIAGAIGGDPAAPVCDWWGKVLLLKDALALAIAGQMPIVNLKQFRDAATPTLACYQALVESTCTVRALHGGGVLPGPFTVRVTECASHRVVEDLGLAGPELEVPFAFRVSMDFTADLGRVVWQAS